MVNCTFVKNIAKSLGGAITIGFNPYFKIEDSQFIENVCLKG